MALGDSALPETILGVLAAWLDNADVAMPGTAIFVLCGQLPYPRQL